MPKTTTSLVGQSNASEPKDRQIQYYAEPGSPPQSGPESFLRPFLPEIHAEILSYLPGRDLKSCSLACQAFHADAIHYLWRSVQVTSDSYSKVEDFFRLMVEDPQRARHIRALSFWFNTWWHDQLFHQRGPHSSSSFWLLFAQALACMSSVVRLELEVTDRTNSNTVSVSISTLNAFYEGLATAAFATRLSHLSFENSSDSSGLSRLIEMFPNLHTLVWYELNPTNSIPHKPTSLAKLQRAHGPPELLAVVSNQSALTTFQITHRNLDSLAERGAEIGRLARGIHSLRHLSMHDFPTNPSAENIPRILPWLGHPKLESLTLDVNHNVRWPISFPAPPSPMLSPHFIFELLAPQSLTHMPSLKFLHMAHVHWGMFDTTDMIDRVYENEIQIVIKGLKGFLETESQSAHRLQHLWIDCTAEGVPPIEMRDRLRFAAERNSLNDDWVVQAKVLLGSENVDGCLGADFSYSRQL
ncbi:hypothetical protein DL93DRAFT_1376129 [Clavulina sp. PMI_390]|nr:hypothetical protein DL93DRAFT_1376129 [Clavulina sp. PMI_390]